MNVGEKVNLSATLVGKNPKANIENEKSSYTWKTSSSKVATISSSGVLTAKNVGKTSINVSTTLSGGKKLSSNFSVIVDDIISQVYIWPNDITINKNSNFKLNIETEPTEANTNNLLWISSNPKVAMAYRNGYIKAISNGKCEISVYRKGKIVTKITVNVIS